MCRKLICLYLALAAALAPGLFAADVNPYVIGNWESTDSNDSWEACTWGPAGNAILTPGVTTGVTLDSAALMLQQDLTVNGGWAWALLVPVSPTEFMAHDILKVDITRLAADWTPGSGSYWNGIDCRVQGESVSLTDLDQGESWWAPSDGDGVVTAVWDYSALKSSFPANPSWVQFAFAVNAQGYSNSTGIFYLDNARLTSIPLPEELIINKCNVKAGKVVNGIQGNDSFDVSGPAVFPSDLTDLTELDVTLTSLADDAIIYEETIDFNGVDANETGKFSYSFKVPSGGPGAITSLKLDFVKGTFAIKAKNIDLTGLAGDLQLDLTMGTTVVSGEANETVINKKKSIPTRLMRTYQDTLIVTKAKAKASTNPSSDSLSVKGEIAVADVNADANEPNLFTKDVVITWSDVNETNVQTFTIPAGYLVQSKTGHTYKCSKVACDSNESLATAKIDLDKCTFTLSIKDANGLYTDPGEARFGLNFLTESAEFDETDDYTLP